MSRRMVSRIERLAGVLERTREQQAGRLVVERFRLRCGVVRTLALPWPEVVALSLYHNPDNLRPLQNAPSMHEAMLLAGIKPDSPVRFDSVEPLPFEMSAWEEMVRGILHLPARQQLEHRCRWYLENGCDPGWVENIREKWGRIFEQPEALEREAAQLDK